jgi:short-subunit dehydrogenase
MIALVQPIADRWISRWARPSAEALAAVAGLVPATVVTGGSEGIGLALARRFQQAGNRVVLIGRDRAKLDEAVRSLRQPGAVPVMMLVLDVTQQGAADELERTLAANRLYLDILVNNAGIGLSGGFGDMDADEVERMLATNIMALTRLMHHALAPMRARARGGIINIASLGGAVPGPYQAAYYASKAYVLSLTEAVAAEVAGQGVRLTAVAPGPVDTGFHAKMGSQNAFYRLFLMPLAADRVAASAIRGFVLGRSVVVPGIVSSLLYVATRLVPHFILVPLMGALLWPRRQTSR